MYLFSVSQQNSIKKKRNVGKKMSNIQKREAKKINSKSQNYACLLPQNKKGKTQPDAESDKEQNPITPAAMR